MSVPLPLRPPEDVKPVQKRDADSPAGINRLVYSCRECGNPIGELCIIGGAVYLSVGGMVDGKPAGVLVEDMSAGLCLSCGSAVRYRFSMFAAKILRRRGFSPEEIRDIIVQTDAGGGIGPFLSLVYCVEGRGGSRPSFFLSDFFGLYSVQGLARVNC